MCGRVTITAPPEAIRELFLFEERPNIEPRYNLAPSQDLPTVRLGREDGRRHFVWLRWGLVPFWAKDVSIGYKMINARAETLFEKPAFRQAAAKRRCLIAVDGFYEWRREGKAKQPYRIRFPGGEGGPDRPFALAGLWERWTDRAKAEDDPDRELETATIVTTAANETMAGLHDRMPVILSPGDFATWLDPESVQAQLASLLAPYAEAAGGYGALDLYPVSTRVNTPKNEDAELVEPLEAEGGQKSLL